VSFYFDFDNFRSYESGNHKVGTSSKPEWDVGLKFNYETRYYQLLAAKRMAITFRDSNDMFIGECRCDLLSLAAGTADCTLTVTNGDLPVGRCTFNLEMEEVAETTVYMHMLKFAFAQDFVLPPLHSVRMRVLTKSKTPFERLSGAPSNLSNQERSVSFNDVAPHKYGTTVQTMLDECGLDLICYVPGYFSDTTLGRARVLFAEFADSAAAGGLGRRTDFEGVPIYNEDGSKIVGTASGTIQMDHMPLFVQMPQGRNIDGTIYEGVAVRGDHPLPPRIAKSTEVAGDHPV
jgi:hypothetical protein